MTNIIHDSAAFVNKIQEEIKKQLNINLNLYNADLHGGYRPPEAKHLWIKISGSPEFCTVYNHKTEDKILIFPNKISKSSISKAKIIITQPTEKIGKVMTKNYSINKEDLKNLEQSNHPYLIKKGLGGVESHGIKIYKNNIVIPMVDFLGNTVANQVITPEGVKFFETGSKPSQAFFLLNGNGKIYNNRKLFYFCEGIATGLTIKKFIPHANIFVCMSCGNLKKVLKSLIDDWVFCQKAGLEARFDLSRVSIIVAADNDHQTQAEKGLNPGLRAANYCLKMNSPQFNRIFCVYPRFKKTDDGSDWNDFMTKYDEINPELMSDYFLNHDVNHTNPKVVRDNKIFMELYVQQKKFFRDMTPEDGLNLTRVKQTIIGTNSMVKDIDEIEKGEIIFKEGHFYTKTPHTKLRKIEVGLKGKIPIPIPLWGKLKKHDFDEGFGDIFEVYDASVFLSDAMFCKKMKVKRVSSDEHMPWTRKVVCNDILNLFQHMRFREPKDIDKSIELFDQLLGYAIRDEYNIRWLKNWFAAAVQNPGQPLQKVPFVIGERGCGKSTLITVAQTFLGIDKPFAIKSSEVFDENKRFGLAPLVENVVAVFDEFEFKRQYNDTVKFILGNENLRYEMKGKDFVTAKRIANVIFNGNLTPRTLAGMSPDERFVVPLVNNYSMDKDKKLEVGLFCDKILKLLKINRTHEDPMVKYDLNNNYNYDDEGEEDHSKSSIYKTPTDFSNDLYCYFKTLEVDWNLLIESQTEKVISSISQELSVEESLFVEKIIATRRFVLNRDDDFIGKEPDHYSDKIQWRENKKVVQKLSSKLTSLFLYCGYHKIYIRLEGISRSFYVHDSIISTTGLNLSKTDQEMILSFYNSKKKLDMN